MDNRDMALVVRPPVERVEPDAILDRPPSLRGEYDPEAEEQARRQSLQRAAIAWENLPYHAAVVVEALRPALAAWTEAVERAVASFTRATSSPEAQAALAALRVMQDTTRPKPATARDRAVLRAQARSRRNSANAARRSPRHR